MPKLVAKDYCESVIMIAGAERRRMDEDLQLAGCVVILEDNS